MKRGNTDEVLKMEYDTYNLVWLGGMEEVGKVFS